MCNMLQQLLRPVTGHIPPSIPKSYEHQTMLACSLRIVGSENLTMLAVICGKARHLLWTAGESTAHVTRVRCLYTTC
jgi:hypothetical protein